MTTSGVGARDHNKTARSRVLVAVAYSQIDVICNNAAGIKVGVNTEPGPPPELPRVREEDPSPKPAEIHI